MILFGSQPEILGSAEIAASIVSIHECPEGYRGGIETGREERYINRLRQEDRLYGRGVQAES